MKCNMEKVVRMAKLFDAYGSLLTEKQQEFMSLYYEEDLSLGEIGHLYGVSRQAVYDILRRAEGLLEDWEAKLGVMAGGENIRQELTKALELVDCLLKETNSAAVLAIGNKLRQILTQLQNM